MGPCEKFFYYRGFVKNLKEHSRKHLDKYSNNSTMNHQNARRIYQENIKDNTFALKLTVNQYLDARTEARKQKKKRMYGSVE